MRRSRIRAVVSIAIVGVLLITSAEAAEEKARPNVLMIAVDDLNDCVGCLQGHPQSRTPNIDRLAKQGTLFTNAHCQAPLCNPSRTSLLTGLRPTTTGIYALAPSFRSVDSLKGRVTLPQHFGSNGYYTATSGKVFHDGSIPTEGQRKEFQVWGTTVGPTFPTTKRVATPDDMKAMDWGLAPTADQDQPDWKIADSAIEHLQKAPEDRPFFVAVGFRLPHVPCFASQKWFDLYPQKTLALPELRSDDRLDIPAFSWFLHWKVPEPRLSWLKQNDQWASLVRAYLASTSFMDSQIGRVLDALEATGRAKDTVIVLFSDHGWHLGEKGITGKNSLWEESTRIPLIIYSPGHSTGRSCEEPVELLDIFPTLTEICAIVPNFDLEGHSLVPQLQDSTTLREWPALTTHNKGNHAVRSKRWRYIRYADKTEELYDHQSDPNEWKNLASDPAFAKIKRDHARWLPTSEVEPAKGSATRLLIESEGIWYWEGEPIVPGEIDEKNLSLP